MKKRFTTLWIGFALLLAGLSYAQENGGTRYDILIRNGTVLDGSLDPGRVCDVAVRNGRIVRVAPDIQGTADRVIEAEGLTVSPGFIDLHTHVDRGMTFQEGRSCMNYLLQGVSSVVVGQCGSSGWPLFEKAEDQIRRWTEEGIGPNAALLAGHGSIRRLVMGMEERAPSPAELEAMKALVKEAMEQGACGISTGLIYRPGSFASTEEVLELVKVIEPYDGMYHSHIRNEREDLLTALREFIYITEEAGVRGHISHFKVLGRPNWGLVVQACDLVEDARRQGLKITADQYPYPFSSNYPYVRLIPGAAWTSEDDPERLEGEDIERLFGKMNDSELIELYSKVTPYFPLSERHLQFLEDLPRDRLVSYVGSALLNTGRFRGPENLRDRMWFLERMEDPESADRIRYEIRKHVERYCGPEGFIVGICPDPELEGKSLQEIAELKGKPYEDVAVDLELMGAKAVPMQMSEADIEFIMQKPYVGTGSDGTTPFYGMGLPHVRSYSTFLYKIKAYGLERNVVSIPHIIRSQTSLPAEIMGWKNRGRIKNSYKADIAVLDLNNIRVESTITRPHRYAEGVKYLLVNGKVVVDGGEYNGTLAGEVIKLKK